MDRGLEVVLVPMKFDDLPLLLAWRQDREVMSYLPSAPVSPTWENHTAWWRGRKDRSDWMVILSSLDGSNRPVGTTHYNWDTGEVGILIGEKVLWGKGVGREALRKTLDWIGAKNCWAVIHPDNIASQRVFGNNGFVWDDEMGRNGQRVYRRKARG